MSSGLTPKKLKKSAAGASGDGKEGRDYDVETQNALKEIEACQNEIDAVYKKASEEILVVKQKYSKLRKPYFDKRNELINRIPNFWFTAFVKHSKISAILNEDEKDCLHFMTKLEVEEFDDIKSGCRISFHFTQNPYFENEVITKEFNLGSSGDPGSQCTTIRWKSGQDLTKKMKETNSGRKGRKRFLEHNTLFGWLTGHSDPSTDDIAEVLKDDMWPNALLYYQVRDIELEQDVKDEDTSNDDDDGDGEDEELVEVEEEEDMEDEGDNNLGDARDDDDGKDEELVEVEEEEDMEDEGNDNLEEASDDDEDGENEEEEEDMDNEGDNNLEETSNDDEDGENEGEEEDMDDEGNNNLKEVSNNDEDGENEEEEEDMDDEGYDNPGDEDQEGGDGEEGEGK